MTHSVLGLITARGGSKGIPHKNTAPLAGKPLINWTIDAALESGCFNRIVVSTDDPDIARIGGDAGAEIPFVRPVELASDAAPHIDVVLHAVNALHDADGSVFDYVMLLQPTSPLRSAAHIRDVVTLAGSHDAEAVVSVREVIDHPYLVQRVLDDGTIEDFIATTPMYKRRQDLPRAVRANGAIYMNRVASLMENRCFVPAGTIPYLMSEQDSIDIDVPWDLELAEWVLRGRKPPLVHQ